jgi:hypothetical protein
MRPRITSLRFWSADAAGHARKVWFLKDHSATSSSPVPAGSRVAFFAGPKKVTKETTGAALGMKRLRGRTFRTAQKGDRVRLRGVLMQRVTRRFFLLGCCKLPRYGFGKPNSKLRTALKVSAPKCRPAIPPCATAPAPPRGRGSPNRRRSPATRQARGQSAGRASRTENRRRD